MQNVLSDSEFKLLKYVLKHDIAACPSQTEIVVTAENMYQQVKQTRLCNNFMKRERIQSPTRVFIYSYIGTYDKQQHAPKMKKINIMKQICETYMNLKPCKGNRIVSMNTVDFYDALRQLFSDKKNLKII